jgi:hypothetical protein
MNDATRVETMTKLPVILYTAHYLTEELLAQYALMRQSCAGRYDVVLLYDNFHDDFAEVEHDLDVDVHLVEPRAIAGLLYPSWPGRKHLEFTSPSGLRPGNWDFAILEYFRAHPIHPYYWRVEYDVRFTGDWRHFFDTCSASQADLLGTTLLRRTDSPPWYWWSSLGRPDGPLDEASTLRGFFPIARLSNRACALLDAQYSAGWYGHAECAMPTVIAHAGLTVEDIGGRGEFVPAGHEERFYRNTPADECLRPGTFVYRPAMPQPGARPNTLWHPVKDEEDHERWLRAVAGRGSTAAQFMLGVICAKGPTGRVDLPESYFWHRIAAAGGHEAAARWRDEVARLLNPSELAEAEARSQRWLAMDSSSRPAAHDEAGHA